LDHDRPALVVARTLARLDLVLPQPCLSHALQRKHSETKFWGEPCTTMIVRHSSLDCQAARRAGVSDARSRVLEHGTSNKLVGLAAVDDA
jgi:hypothetical protein